MSYKNILIQRKYQLDRCNLRRFIWMMENGPCVMCGSWKDIELDHIDPSKKFTHRIWSYSEQKLSKELDKCQALCKNCHKKKTSKWYLSNRIHGLANTYKNGCRCQDCTNANRIYQKNYYDKNGRKN